MQLPSDNRFITTRKRFHEVLDEEYGPEEVNAFLAVLCNAYLQWNRADMVLHANRPLSESELLKFHFALKELLSGKPLQYILGESHFLGLRFLVNEHVLIPRPETEELVMHIHHSLAKKNTAHILDIGTGSGCIPVALKHLNAHYTTEALDVSEKALEVARENARRNQTEVLFHLSDILKDEYIAWEKKWDLIVSNPPYILEEEKEQMKRNVLNFEPHLALFVNDKDPILFYRVIAQKALKWLNSEGSLWFEINPIYALEIQGMLNEAGFSHVELLTDLQGKTRMVKASH
jgi:release factor glutamine methyltransferase